MTTMIPNSGHLRKQRTVSLHDALFLANIRYAIFMLNRAKKPSKIPEIMPHRYGQNHLLGAPSYLKNHRQQ